MSTLLFWYVCIELFFSRAAQDLLILLISFHLLHQYQMDCCHSGTALDLPYEINATQSQMHASDSFNFAGLLGDQASMACCLCLVYLLSEALFDG